MRGGSLLCSLSVNEMRAHCVFTHGSEHKDEDQGAGHQASVPGPLGLVNSRNPQEDEDDGLCNAGQSLHGVLHSSPGLLRDICLHILVAANATECQPVKVSERREVLVSITGLLRYWFQFKRMAYGTMAHGNQTVID